MIPDMRHAVAAQQKLVRTRSLLVDLRDALEKSGHEAVEPGKLTADTLTVWFGGLLLTLAATVNVEGRVGVHVSVRVRSGQGAEEVSCGFHKREFIEDVESFLELAVSVYQDIARRYGDARFIDGEIYLPPAG